MVVSPINYTINGSRMTGTVAGFNVNTTQCTTKYDDQKHSSFVVSFGIPEHYKFRITKRIPGGAK